MEDSREATAFVDFANCDLHIHTVDASATQEEVLFSTCPEAFPGIMFCARMRDSEAIIIRGCRRFCEYKGYLGTFDFNRALIPPLPAQDIIAIDAAFDNHFAPQRIVRDLNKALLGFLQCTGDRNKISTGHWGCGAFGGDKLHKFLVQLSAATLANTELYYSAYNDNDIIKLFTSTMQDINRTRLTVKDLLSIMLLYKDQRKMPFAAYFDTQLAAVKTARSTQEIGKL